MPACGPIWSAAMHDFQMVEHLMAALAALEIDNCIVETGCGRIAGTRRQQPRLCAAAGSIGFDRSGLRRDDDW